MKTTYKILAFVGGLVLLALLSFAVTKAAQDITKTIALGISNMYSTQGD